MNYYERHIGDYLRDASHLTLLEHGVYSRLLDVYYTRESGIPSDVVERVIGARAPKEVEAIGVVLREFFKLVDGVWTHSRCDREIERYLKKVEHNRSVGKLGGRPKKSESQEKPPGLFPGSQQEPKHNPLQTPDTSKRITPPLPAVVAPLTGPPDPKAKANPAPKVERPDGVSVQVWDDWTALRKAKKAPVTSTVLEHAVGEAAKASLTLEAFLRVWCARGSQGLQADWLKPHERGSQTSAEPAWRTEQRERAVAFAGPYAVRHPVSSPNIIEADDHDDPPAKKLG